jgi:hypothetical protein
MNLYTASVPEVLREAADRLNAVFGTAGRHVRQTALELREASERQPGVVE